MTSTIAATRKAARQAASTQSQKRFLSRRPVVFDCLSRNYCALLLDFLCATTAPVKASPANPISTAVAMEESPSSGMISRYKLGVTGRSKLGVRYGSDNCDSSRINAPCRCGSSRISAPCTASANAQVVDTTRIAQINNNSYKWNIIYYKTKIIRVYLLKLPIYKLRLF